MLGKERGRKERKERERKGRKGAKKERNVHKTSIKEL